jgi:transposase-like protein
LLDAFARSGLSAADFARRHGLHYTTLYNWRRARSKRVPAFVEVDVSAAAAPVELVIELGAKARLRLNSEAQMPLAARLLQTLQEGRPC